MTEKQELVSSFEMFRTKSYSSKQKYSPYSPKAPDCLAFFCKEAICFVEAFKIVCIPRKVEHSWYNREEE